MIISITGRSGSGKSTAINNLIKIIGHDNICYLHQDSYYKDQSHLQYEKRSKLNFDDPHTIDIDLYTLHLLTLAKGFSIEKPVYNYKTHTRSHKIETIYSKKIILTEGIHVHFTEQLRDLADIKVFVDVSKDICFIRRLLRDTLERNRTIESIINQYLETVRPTQEKFISPLIKYADFIISDGGNNLNDISRLASIIKKRS
jgi:uridine kinase